jgi:hypothetical protein
MNIRVSNMNPGLVCCLILGHCFGSHVSVLKPHNKNRIVEIPATSGHEAGTVGISFGAYAKHIPK